MSVHMLPKSIAVKFPQGEARQEPNSDPYLPDPPGRIKFTLNPLEMLQ